MKKLLAIVAVAVISAFGISSAVSATGSSLTWTGDGDGTLWSDGDNWSTDTAPVDGDEITFDFDVLEDGDEIENDIEDLELDTIIYDGEYTGSDQPVISGNALLVTTAPSTSEDTSAQMIDVQLDITWKLTEDSEVPFREHSLGSKFSAFNVTTVDLNGYNIENETDISCGVSFPTITGEGDIVFSGETDLAVTSAFADFSGSITVNDGILALYGGTYVDNAKKITVNNGATLRFVSDEFSENVDLEYDVPIVVNGSDGHSDFAKITLNFFGVGCSGAGGQNAQPVNVNNITINSNVDFSGQADLTITDESYGDNGKLISVADDSTGGLITPLGEEEGSEQVTEIEKGEEAAGPITVLDKQTLVVNGTMTNGTDVIEGGTLMGEGDIEGFVSIAKGGTLAPGNSPGCLSSDGLSLSGTFEVELSGTEVCDEYDQMQVTGTVTLDDAEITLILLDGFIPEVGDEFIIISNDGSDEVVGQMDGLDEGDTTELAGATFEISYEGGDGNDVTLTVQEISDELAATGFDSQAAISIASGAVLVMLTVLATDLGSKTRTQKF